MKRPLTKAEFSPMFRHFTNVLCDRIKVNGLPEEIDEKFFLYHVLLFGRVLMFKLGDKLHVMWFSGKGNYNEYYIQEERLVVNPWLPEIATKSYDFDNNNSVIVYSDINAYLDNCDAGLYDFCVEYSRQVDSIDKSIRALTKNAKLIAILTGSSNSFLASARRILKELFADDNDQAVAVMEESMIDNIKVNPISDRLDYKLSELIKTRQYFISDFYQKIGVASNQNMKKERLTDNESELIEGVANVDFNHVINYLNFSIKKANDLFGINISFELNEKKEEKEEEKKEKEEDESSQLDKKESEENEESNSTERKDT